MAVKTTAGQEHAGTYFAYVRVSTDDQDVARQEMEILKWLNGGNHSVVWFKEEGISGKIAPEHRPKLNECIETAKAMNGTIIVADLDRFSRTTWHTLKFFETILKKNAVKLVVCNDPTISENKQNFYMKAMFADFERDKISERTKSGLERIKKELREKGSITSSNGNRITKLGIHDEMDKARASASTAVKTIADNFAQKIGPTIKELKLGGLNYRLVAMHLNKLEVPTARVGKWHASSVRNVLWRYTDSNVTKRLEKK